MSLTNRLGIGIAVGGLVFVLATTGITRTFQAPARPTQGVVHIAAMIAADVAENAVFEAIFGTDPIHYILKKTTGIDDPIIQATHQVTAPAVHAAASALPNN